MMIFLAIMMATTRVKLLWRNLVKHSATSPVTGQCYSPKLVLVVLLMHWSQWLYLVCAQLSPTYSLSGDSLTWLTSKVCPMVCFDFYSTILTMPSSFSSQSPSLQREQILWHWHFMKYFVSSGHQWYFKQIMTGNSAVQLLHQSSDIWIGTPRWLEHHATFPSILSTRW